jgi:hypothetical protein
LSTRIPRLSRSSLRPHVPAFAVVTSLLAAGPWAVGLEGALRWPGVMLAPGAAAYLLAARSGPRVSLLVLCALILSPVLTTLCGVAGLAAGLPPASLAGWVAAASFLACAAALLAFRPRFALPDRRSLLWLGALLAVIVLLTAFLPMTRSWWRIRSDAWFHAAVVAQIAEYGLPPRDPYFAGMELQYMWFYHVLVLVLSRGLDLDPFRVMALVNIQAVVALGVGAWQLAGVFRRAFAHRLAATLMMLLGFNGAFWWFLPVKLVKATIGDVRGLNEIRRTYSLVPFDYTRACEFMNIYYNQEFFLDKYMVATAFGLSLSFMVAGWYAAADYLATRRGASLALLAGALVGMLGFHSLVGFVILVGIFGGAILAWLFRDRTRAFPGRAVAVVLGVSLASFLATTPYLYAVMHLKEKEQVFPLSVSLHKTIGIFISSAFALVLFLVNRPLLRERSPHTRFFLLGALSVTVFCLVITLPGPNTYDKLGYFVFVPVSVLGGIALAQMWLDGHGRSRRALAGLAAACMLPVNVLAFSAAFSTPDQVEVTPPEARLGDWLRENTPRDALLLDDNDRVVFLVTVPRRYLWGSWAYAQQWGYPRLEMSRRLHTRRALYSARELDATALEVLGGVQEPLYAVVRPAHRAAGAALLARPDLFQVVHEDPDGYAVVRVDTALCRALAAGRTDRVSPEELIRESGF